MTDIDPQKVVLVWSGRKASLLTLHAEPYSETMPLLMTMTQEYRRIGHHGVRKSLREQQGSAGG